MKKNIRNRYNFQQQSGLTLVEIMIVLIILGVVMATIGNKLFQAGDRAKASITETTLQGLKADIEQFQLRYNAVPSSLDDLVKCTAKTGPGCIPITNEEALVDAWGTKLKYQASGRTYKITSLGADGKTGGEGVNYDFSIEGP